MLAVKHLKKISVAITTVTVVTSIASQSKTGKVKWWLGDYWYPPEKIACFINFVDGVV